MYNKTVIKTIIGACCLFSISVYGQVPVIKASSRFVDIKDGMHFREKIWHLLPQKKPDVYYVEIPHKEHTVTFLTDLDSISFHIKYGGRYDFVIVLNNKDSCYTQIRADYKEKRPYRSNHSYRASDTIPFRIGDNSKIYFTGQLNNSGSLDIQFDFGNSGAPIIKKSSLQKTQVRFDDSIVLSNSDGTNVVPFSRRNRLTIGRMMWDSIPVAVADNMTSREDLVAGNYLFQDKIIEINYDRKLIIIHDTLPLIEDGYIRHDMILEAGIVPLVYAVLFFGSKKVAGWFMFDTGAYTSIFDSETIPAFNKMKEEAKKLIGWNDTTMQPALTIGNYHFANFNYTTQKLNTTTCVGLLGNDLLKRFNIVVDNKNGHLYLKPNSLIAEPYANPEFYAIRVIAGFVLLVLPAIIIFIKRRIKRVKKKSSLVHVHARNHQ